MTKTGVWVGEPPDDLEFAQKWKLRISVLRPFTLTYSGYWNPAAEMPREEVPVSLYGPDGILYASGPGLIDGTIIHPLGDRAGPTTVRGSIRPTGRWDLRA